MVETRITIYGEKHAARTLEGIGDRAANARPAMEEIYLTILDIEEETFEKEGARGSFPRWVENSFATIEWKARHRYHPAILRATDKLRTAMTTYRHPDAITRITGLQIQFQPKLTAIPYGRIQYKGGKVQNTGSFKMKGARLTGNLKIVAGAIPPRPYIRFTELDANAFAKEIMRHLMRPQKGAGKLGVTFNG